MSRPLRIESPGAYYHIMDRGLAYQDIFTGTNSWFQVMQSCIPPNRAVC